MEKKGVIGLDALISILVAVFVLVSILYAESKLMSVQNMELKKEAKRLSLMAEAMQMMPNGFNTEYKEINYSMSISNGKVALSSPKNGWKSENTYVSFSGMRSSCSLKTTTVRVGDRDVDKLPFAMFEKAGDELSCSDKNLQDERGDEG